MTIEGEPSHEGIDWGEPVIVDGKFFGSEKREFDLKSMTEPMLGGDKFDEVYLETISGNIYCIRNFVPKGIDEDEPYGVWIIDARSNAGRDVKKNGLSATMLTGQEIAEGVVRVGGRFGYGQGGRTTEIKRITCVQTRKIYHSDDLREMTPIGRTSDIRSRFAKLISPKS